MTKESGGPKTMITDVFKGLNERSKYQLAKEKISVREVGP
jgi:hypothetical protein